jgi:hypothetical protein
MKDHIIAAAVISGTRTLANKPTPVFGQVQHLFSGEDGIDLRPQLQKQDLGVVDNLGGDMEAGDNGLGQGVRCDFTININTINPCHS